jgi:hypothetical protein
MDVDIRVPIGLLFAILGLILVVFGLYSMNDAALYARSLGRNINLWTGLTMLLFGGLMLFFSLRKKKAD